MQTILYQEDLFSNLSLLDSMSKNTKRVLIADEYFRGKEALFLSKELKCLSFFVKAGECAKTEEKKKEIETFLYEEKCNKDTTLIAMGGGTITDLVGFVASTYMRGVPLIFIPTTLLAMVDASIGGKTAINTSFGKNLLGTIYLPKAIFCHFGFLKTLPLKEWQNGMAEIFKMALIRDSSIFLSSSMEEKIQKAISKKIGIVTEDPYDQGLRKILNFGHTVGHALEAIAYDQISHGEAVSLGCLAETHLSMSLGFLDPKEFSNILSFYKEFSLKLPKNYSRKKLLKKMALDKKNRKETIHSVLIDKIGHAVELNGHYVRAISEGEWEPSLSWMEELCSSLSFNRPLS
jgi:3-dehydroquinate synthase